MTKPQLFFSGIGGSGMLPLALIVQGMGTTVSGSDRSQDQGRTPEKFAFLAAHGITLAPQDGSGLTPAITEMIVSTAVEDNVPDVVAARALDIPITRRAALLARLFNSAPRRVAVAGTSGKSTITGMIAFALKELGECPTVMNGAVMRDFVTPANPYASALIGDGSLFVTEADESDGSIALYNPDVAVISNIALDHKSMDELRALFTGFAARAQTIVLNHDHAETAALAVPYGARAVTYSLVDPAATIYRPELTLAVPGVHNRANALAALGVIHALGLDVNRAASALTRFTGIKRRLETVGQSSGITVIDDFAHNPDKITGSLAALHETPGRLLVLFQPHGYGALRLAGRDMAAAFATQLRRDDLLFITEPLYLGGTVDRSVTGADLAGWARMAGCAVTHGATRDALLPILLDQARAGDRIVVMGARDDTLSTFATMILGKISSH